MHLLAQSPTASFWQVIGHVFNIQLHGRDFPTWAKLSLLGAGHLGMFLRGCPVAVWGCRAGGIAWDSSTSGKRVTSGCSKGSQDQHSATCLGPWQGAQAEILRLPRVLCVCPEEQPVRAPPAQPGANTPSALGHCLCRGDFASLEEIKSDFGFQGSL